MPPGAAPAAPQLRRCSGGRVIGGVAGGLAEQLGYSPLRVRIVFAVLTLLFGVGALWYAALWIFTPPGEDTASPEPVEYRRSVGIALLGIFGAAGLMSVSLGKHFAIAPVVIVAIGAALVWREADRVPVSGRRGPRVLTAVRWLGGAALVVGGALSLIIGRFDGNAASTTIAAVAITVVGIAILLTPLVIRMWRDLGAERAALARTTEREEIASHLHDSVLQTLALIQKQAEDPAVIRKLARSQERELRTWLFSGPDTNTGSLVAGLNAAAAEVEDVHGITVEVVAVGDAEFGDFADDGGMALIAATKEALVNAAKHSGQRGADVYAEVGADEVAVFVRDRGIGFDIDSIATDRQGIARSIRSRIERRGGKTEIISGTGRGTEVRITLPRRTAAVHPAPGSDAVAPGPSAGGPTSPEQAPPPDPHAVLTTPMALPRPVISPVPDPSAFSREESR